MLINGMALDFQSGGVLHDSCSRTSVRTDSAHTAVEQAQQCQRARPRMTARHSPLRGRDASVKLLIKDQNQRRASVADLITPLADLAMALKI
jgi:hypothetical protein